MVLASTSNSRFQRAACRARARGQQACHPAGVVGGDEVQRAAHRPAPDDARVSQVRPRRHFGRLAHAQPHRPERAEIVLRLDGAEPGHDGRGLVEQRPGEALGRQPPAQDVCGTVSQRNAGAHRSEDAATRAPWRERGCGGTRAGRRRLLHGTRITAKIETRGHAVEPGRARESPKRCARPACAGAPCSARTRAARACGATRARIGFGVDR